MQRESTRRNPQNAGVTMIGNWGQIVGTPWYIDPAYQMCTTARAGEYHRYSDVYSMGVTLLQALTGLDVRFQTGTKSRDNKAVQKQNMLWCIEAFEDKLGPCKPTNFVHTNIQDPQCQNWTQRALADRGADWPEDKAVDFLKLGMDMTESNPKDRPTVKECIDRLEGMLA